MHLFNIWGGGTSGGHFLKEVSAWGIKIDNPSTITLGRSIFYCIFLLVYGDKKINI
jgi:hypothetical protein